jgi:hypothetical protein
MKKIKRKKKGRKRKNEKSLYLYILNVCIEECISDECVCIC